MLLIGYASLLVYVVKVSNADVGNGVYKLKEGPLFHILYELKLRISVIYLYCLEDCWRPCGGWSGGWDRVWDACAGSSRAATASSAAPRASWNTDIRAEYSSSSWTLRNIRWWLTSLCRYYRRHVALMGGRGMNSVTSEAWALRDKRVESSEYI